ncbi:hypothetical protein Y032_1232g3776, partial [Ancylostoma ceylanicum]
EQSIDEEMEAMILMEADEGKRIADLQVQVAGLTQQLRELTEKQAPQVRAMVLSVSEQVAKIREVLNWLRKGGSKKSPTKISGKSGEDNHLKLEAACNGIEQEISKLQQLSRHLEVLGKLDLDQLAECLNETLEQACHDDCAMRALSKLLEVDSTQVVETVKTTLLLGSKSTLRVEVPRADDERPENDNTMFFQAQSDQPSTSGIQPASFREAMMQVRTNDVPAELQMAEFDPIAAAEGERSDLFPQSSNETSQVRQHILPQRRINPHLQRQQLANEPPKLQESLWKSPWRRCQGENSLPTIENMVNNSVSAAFAAMALPDVPVYDQPQGKGFDKFLRSFLMKYGGLNLDDEMLIHLLCSKLGGQPRAVMEALPQDVRDGTFEGFASALMTKFKENESARRMEAYIKLKKLKPSTSITEYCVELEQLSRAAYLESTERELSILRTGELISQLTEWPEYVQLFTVVEQTATEEAYEKLKNMAQRVERSRQVALSLKQGYGDKPKRSSAPWRRATSTRTILQSSGDNNALQTEQKQVYPTQSDKPKAQKKSEPICHNCKKPGHFRRDCRELVQRGTSVKQAGNLQDREDNKQRPQENAARTFSTTLRHWSCRATHAKGRGNELVGDQTLETVELLGLKRRALLDSGSQISILPLELLVTAQNAGFDLDSDVEEIPQLEHPSIYDASGNPMNFKGAVRLSIRLKNGPKQRLAFFVMKGSDGRLVLGTNTLKVLGYSLCKVENNQQTSETKRNNMMREKSRQKRKSKNSKEYENSTAKNSAKVVARVYIKPGETKTVEVTAPNCGKENVLWSSDKMVPDVICAANNATVRIPITNSSTESRMYRSGEAVGQWDTTKMVEETPLHYANMLERTASSPPERTATLLQLLRENKNDHENEASWQSLVESNNDVFAVTDQELTQTTLIEHDIDTGSAEPIRQKARPIPLGTRTALRQILLDLQERNIIQPSKSSWASPIVLVQKKDGTLRLCVDYRRVNQVTRIDSYPLPTIDAMLQNLKGKRIFSTLDLSSGYWQIKLSPGGQERSAFTTTEGLYEFKVLPFGLASSPPVFQRLMHAVLGHLLGDEVACYLDDVMIATCTVERHLEVLEQVFDAFRKANLKLNPRKCVLFERKVEFLGHMVDAEGVHMDPGKVSSIVDYPLPQSRTDLRTFIGMCSYYRKFVLGFSKVAGPLHELTSEKQPFIWTPERVQAFEELKRIITSAPVLSQPDIEGARSGRKPFKIHTDASYSGLGAVLSQEGDDGLLHPVYFASKSLTKSERNYHITDLEALAVVFALRKFHMFVYGLRVEVCTDHQPLMALFNRSNVSARVLRWALELQKYNLKMVYLKGAANKVADALSRGTVNTQHVERSDSIPNELIVATISEENKWTSQLRNDPVYGKVITALENDDAQNKVEFPGVA